MIGAAHQAGNNAVVNLKYYLVAIESSIKFSPHIDIS